MTTSSVGTVRTAIANALAARTGLHVSPHMSTTINPPQAMIDYRVAYDTDMGPGGDTFTWLVYVFMPASSERSSSTILDELRDPNSTTGVKQLLEGNAGLRAVVNDVQVKNAGEIDVFAANDAAYLFCQFEVDTF